jgi:hypothetical protein
MGCTKTGCKNREYVNGNLSQLGLASAVSAGMNTAFLKKP